MIQHPDSRYIDLVKIEIKDQPAHCAFVEAETDGKPWYMDIKMLLEKGEYPEGITLNQKRTIRKLANGFFLSKNVLCKRTPDLRLLRCVDSFEATRLIEEVYAGTCRPHMNGFVQAKKILRTGYYWMTIENDCSKFDQKCHRRQIHEDLIKVPPTELNTRTSSCPFTALGMDVIGPIEPATSNKYHLILEAELDDAEWIRKRYEQLALIDEKRMIAVCHGQLYQHRMARAFNKRVRTRVFQIRQLSIVILQEKSF
ncbi:uncharacterized protein LOC132612956 [Lycium barbarum]|uniref:uncharacterized protein LOC132612956 n=1 Tax=Lycium barbarum TaxID=112863 RepID=UPI00293E6ADE|nr:uncharacterized protein LOC132612956 [Lycium barbarum]